ncbi:MAG: EamA family transporter [Candidatus Lokiarchaeota archaeon]|nr:EamA family transporter [Candidatus Lokiarchaeota archaeon]
MLRKIKKEYIGYIMVILSMIFYGISTPINKILLSDLHPLILSGWIYLTSGLLLSLSFKFNSIYEPIKVKDTPKLIIIILTGSILAPLLIFFGLMMISAFYTSLFLNFEVIFTIIIAMIFLHEKIGKRAWIGIITILMSLFLWSFLTSQMSDGSLAIPGSLLILAGCLCWAIDNNITQTLGNKSPIRITSIKGVFGGATSLLIGLFFNLEISIKLSELFLILFIGFFSFGLSIVFFITALKYIGTVKTSIIFSSSPFVGAIVAIFLNQEVINWLDILIFSLVLIGFLCVVTDRHIHFHRHKTLIHSHLFEKEEIHHKTITKFEKQSSEEYGIHHSLVHKHQPFEHEHIHSHDIHHRHVHSNKNQDESRKQKQK